MLDNAKKTYPPAPLPEGKGKMMRFVPFAKFDDEQRMVWGRATDETPDSEAEVVDYGATKRAVADWSQWRNVREMHGSTAAGVAEEISLDDTAKTFDIGVRVVDDGAWQKVKAGVYKGFSIGGKKMASIVEKAGGKTVTRITDYLLTEISLVDRPANPSAVFSMVKREFTSEDGTAEEETGEETAPEGESEDGEAPMAEGENSETPAAESEMEAGEEETAAEEQPMSSEMVRSLVLSILEEVGLVRPAAPTGQAGEMSMTDQVADLRKRLDASTTLSMQKRAADEVRLAELSSSMTKISGGLGQLAGDLVKAAVAVDGLDDRMEALEKRMSEAGPVRPALREIGFGSSTSDVGEEALKSLMSQTDDPAMKQFLGQELAKMQIKAVQGMGGGRV